MPPPLAPGFASRAPSRLSARLRAPLPALMAELRSANSSPPSPSPCPVPPRFRGGLPSLQSLPSRQSLLSPPLAPVHIPHSAAALPPPSRPPPRAASSIDGRATLGQFQPPPYSPHPVLCRRVFAVAPPSLQSLPSRLSNPSRPLAPVLHVALRRGSSPAPARLRAPLPALMAELRSANSSPLPPLSKKNCSISKFLLAFKNQVWYISRR